ncbi:hypothetical protein SAMN05660909_01331 [Chitinophaga terrae (ex Kim and Jung 2007)]|uniref:Uncharacterized protein n=1 Tax=Chitinophaga terrae (ex Kim and Jung 2007) TaxID=408074 RepID=A0A1H3ZWT4_9BACT|nr:DUF6702 family protein [Chitinophaga terrae (ex Kim and Jung 2007)]MDQ0106162.1 hypothetical protein [Chitinophaga terrae (ex Kim and Jung 2007)]SEA27891.1 hypothetical protein SAMN05660909_01331 [Chitinophaga terrae (ex Kim and Jung 2007)]
MGVLLCKWWMACWLTVLHPFYVSVTEIAHDAGKQELQVTCRIFTDDLENTLRAQFKTPVDITNPANRKKVDEYIAAYLSQHLVITLDGKTVSLHYLGYKIEEDAVWSFLEAEKIPVPKTVQVKNDLLYEKHPTQINMIHVMVNGTRKSSKLDNPKSLATFSF